MTEGIIGFCVGFTVCVIMLNSYHKRIADRGYMSVNDKIYEVKLKDSK